MRDNRNLVSQFSEKIQKLSCGTNGKRIRIAMYVTAFVAVIGMLGFGYGIGDSASVSLPSTTSTANINPMQGQNTINIQLDGATAGSSASAGAVSGAASQVKQTSTSKSSDNGSGAQANSATSTANTVAEVKSVNLASSVAAAAGLSSSNSVSSNAESANINSELAQADTTSASKRQITEPTTTTKAIDTYKVKDGDNVQTVAAKFDVTADTVRFANNLTTDNLVPGTDVTVPATDGVVYTMKDGDKLSDVTTKYKSNMDDVLAMNNLSSDAVATGTRLLLPDGVLPDNEKPGYVAPQTNRTNVSTNKVSIRRGNIGVPTARDNRYAYGYCTWYAFNRRVQLGLPIANRWGNANTWDTSAQSAGLLVNKVPTAGAIFQTDSGPYGHVGIVERVNSDGSIYVSEMNYSGWGVRSFRTISNLSGYDFIH